MIRSVSTGIQTIDSMKCEFPRSALRSFNSGYFTTNTKTDNSSYLDLKEVLNGKLLTNAQHCGLKSITITDESVVLEISAKILESDYCYLLNEYTIRTAIENLNRRDIVDIDIKKFVEETQVYRCDVTNDLPVNSEIRDIISTLKTFGALNDRWDCRKYQNNGVVFTKRGITVKDRFTAYDKQTEMLRDKKYRDFLGAGNFDGMLRIESNLKGFRAMRDAFKIDSRYLMDILSCREPVNLLTFQSIVRPEEVEKMKRKFNELADGFTSLAQAEKHHGMNSIIKTLNYDIDLILEYVGQFYSSGSNISRIKRRYREQAELLRITEQTEPENRFNDEHITEIENLLRVA